MNLYGDAKTSGMYKRGDRCRNGTFVWESAVGRV